MFEKQREHRKEAFRAVSEKKSEHLKKVKETNIEKEEKKRAEYFTNQELAEKRKKKLEEILKVEAEAKRQEDILNEQKRLEVKEKFDKTLADKKQFYLDKLQEQEEKVGNTQMRRKENLKEKHNLDVLNRFKKGEKVRRILKRQDYEREKLMMKISRDYAKAEEIKQEKASLLETRARIRDEIMRNKKSLLDKIQKIKMGKVFFSFLDKVFQIHSS